MSRYTRACFVAGMAGLFFCGSAMALDDDVAALVIDNGSGMWIAGFAGDDLPEARAAPANIAMGSPKTGFTQTLLTTDQCGNMTTDEFFSHSFVALDFRRAGKITCDQTHTRLAAAFHAADSDHDGFLTAQEFDAFKARYGRRR